MQELTTTANLVEYEALDDGRSITAVLERSELEAALHADESARLWVDLGSEGDDETFRLTIDVTASELEEMLRRSTGDEFMLALDADAVAGLFDDPDFEAHGMRGALAIAVATAAVAAPAGQAAVAQTVGAAATAQRASVAATAQQVGAAATTQVSNLAAKAQVSKAQVSKAQVSKAATKAQVSKSLVVKAAGVKLLRSGFAR